MAKWTIYITGRGHASGGIPADVDRLAREFLAKLRAEGCDVLDASCYGEVDLDAQEVAAATSDSPNSDLPLSDGPQLE